MNITNPYDPKQGLMIISHSGSQKYTEKLDLFSQTLTDLYVSSFNDNNKYCIDSCWESGNIYYANYNEGYVRKIKYDGTEVARLNLSNPFMVSIVQNANKMNSIIDYPPQNDQGCWIVDDDTGRIVKTDKKLNITAEISGFYNSVCIKADPDGGCYVVRQTLSGGSITKLSATAQILASMDYITDFSPAVTRFIDMAIDINGLVYFCADDRIYNLIYDPAQATPLSQVYVLYPLGTGDPFSSSSSSNSRSYPMEEQHVGAIDIDRNVTEQYIYVTGGNSYESFVLKYAYGILVAEKQYYDMAFPYVLKVIQGMGSDSLYLLEDSSKWDTYTYGSSSSESESSQSSSSSSMIVFCTDPFVTEGSASSFGLWSFNAITNSNSDNGKLYLVFVGSLSVQNVYVYKDSLYTQEVAFGQAYAFGIFSLNSTNGSGLNGTAWYTGAWMNGTATLDCYESSSSTSSSSSINILHGSNFILGGGFGNGAYIPFTTYNGQLFYSNSSYLSVLGFDLDGSWKIGTGGGGIPPFGITTWAKSTLGGTPEGTYVYVPTSVSDGVITQ